MVFILSFIFFKNSLSTTSSKYMSTNSVWLLRPNTNLSVTKFLSFIFLRNILKFVSKFSTNPSRGPLNDTSLIGSDIVL